MKTLFHKIYHQFGPFKTEAEADAYINEILIGKFTRCKTEFKILNNKKHYGPNATGYTLKVTEHITE